MFTTLAKSFIGNWNDITCINYMLTVLVFFCGGNESCNIITFAHLLSQNKDFFVEIAFKNTLLNILSTIHTKHLSTINIVKSLITAHKK